MTAMIEGTLRKVGEQLAVTIPEEEVRRLGLREGQKVSIEVQPLGPLADLPEDLGEAFTIEFREGQAGLRYLAER